MEIDNRADWSVGIGRWGGVPVRLHMLFFLFAALSFYFAWYTSQDGSGEISQLTAIGSLLILFGSVVVHELGHIFAATHFACRVFSIELLPWGGNSETEYPVNPRHRLLIASAGPIVNLVICLIAMLLLIQGAHTSWQDLGSLFNPFVPVGIVGTDFAESTIKQIFWINWLLFLVNMLPVFPFDGGLIIRFLVPSVWRSARNDQIFTFCVWTSYLACLGLFVSAWLLREADQMQLIPTWFVLVIFGIIVLFSTKRQTKLDVEALEASRIRREGHMRQFEDESLDSYGFDDSLEEGSISDWLHQHKRIRERQERESEIQEDERVDEILERLHKFGMESLDEHDRALLQRVSARYRTRIGREQ